MPPVTRPKETERYPYPAYYFVVSVTNIDDGTSVSGSFSEVSGLSVEVTPIEYRDGTGEKTMMKLPGLAKYGNITLKRGVSGHIGFWNWIRRGMNGDVQRQEGYIALHNEDRQEVMRWNFRNAWPTKYTGPGFDATTNKLAIETLEFVHERCEIDV
jgi:phage tail-like protein